MSHHGEGLPPQINNFDELMDRLAAKEEKFKPFSPVMEKLGATGNHPDGKLTEDDEGEIRLAIGHTPGKVIIDFGDKPIKWIGFNTTQARQIAMTLIEHADKCMLIKP